MALINEKTKLYILLAWLLFSISLYAEDGQLGEDASVSTSAVSGLALNKNRFFRFNNSIELSFDLSLKKGNSQYFDYILRIADLNKQRIEVILNLEDNNNELIIIANDRLSKKTINLKKQDFQENLIHFNFLFDLKSDELILSLHDTVYIESRLGLKPHSDYRIILGAPNIQTPPSTKISNLLITNIETSPDLIGTGTSAKNRVSTLLWVIIIVVVDIIIFVYIIWKRRKKRRKEIESDSANQSPESSNIDMIYRFEKATRIEEQHKSTILLFNHFQVFDKEGNEISKKFSPLLKELFLILLLYSLKDKQGISISVLKDLLWFDKEWQSANNNRAVNIGKLKAILDTVGDYDITSNNHNISIELGDNIYCDYSIVLNLLQQGRLSKEEVINLILMTERGSFLPECNYEWIDRFKAIISDSLIDNLWEIAELLKVEIDAKLILQIADTIFNFDNLNERALILKCSTLMYLGKHSIANTAYIRFVKDYENVYQEPYKVQFLQVCSYFIKS